MTQFLGLFGYVNSYSAFSKKDDDYGIVELRQWVNAHTQEQVNKIESLCEFNKYAIALLQQLPVLTSSNYQIAQDHLVILAKQSDFLRKAFIKNIALINTDHSIRRDIASKLILTWSIK